jgi:Ribbon-helix-helix protein, copG family
LVCIVVTPFWLEPRCERGRPPSGGRDPGVHIRLPKEMIEAIDAYSAAEQVNRSEGIRRLVEIALGRARPIERPAAAKTRSASAERAKELAEKTIERLADPETPSEEKVVRRRRLVKGPSEFREDRIDQPRPKKR